MTKNVKRIESCRMVGRDEFFVHYVLKEDEDAEKIEVKNETHAASTPVEYPDEQFEFDWKIDVPNEPYKPAHIYAVEGCDPTYFELSHHLSEQTLRQIADMFLTAAIQMRLRDQAEDIAAFDAAQKVQDLPFDNEKTKEKN